MHRDTLQTPIVTPTPGRFETLRALLDLAAQSGPAHSYTLCSGEGGVWSASVAFTVAGERGARPHKTKLLGAA